MFGNREQDQNIPSERKSHQRRTMGVGSKRGRGGGEEEAGGGEGAAAEFGKVERICPFARVYEIYSRKDPGERMVG